VACYLTYDGVEKSRIDTNKARDYWWREEDREADLVDAMPFDARG